MEFSIYHLVALLVLAGAVFWAFGKKRKARFEEDAKIPFEDNSHNQDGRKQG
jgi:cytochrome c oxidase cbb3-type subunit 4